MRYFFVAGIALLALSNSAFASDYMGWYLGAGIGYGYPALIPASGRGDCIHSNGKIFTHAGKLYCAHKVAGGEKGSAARSLTREDERADGPASIKLIRGQHTEFMWQGMSARPDSKFNGDCAKQSGKVSQHANGKWYCNQP